MVHSNNSNAEQQRDLSFRRQSRSLGCHEALGATSLKLRYHSQITKLEINFNLLVPSTLYEYQQKTMQDSPRAHYINIAQGFSNTECKTRVLCQKMCLICLNGETEIQYHHSRVASFVLKTIMLFWSRLKECPQKKYVMVWKY